MDETEKMNSVLKQIRSKMTAGGVGEPAIRSFLSAAEKVMAGETGMIPEDSIDPTGELPHLDSLGATANEGLLNSLAVVKLNGGLGTGMGLSRAKSLIQIRDGETFLDFIARQILHLREHQNAPRLSFLLMNSFSTQADTLKHLERHPELPIDGEIDFLQSKAPKLHANTFEPVDWPEDPELEWCPPGHGDLYPSLLGSGMLNRLLDRGVKYLFVSNSDNLGATVDQRLLQHFAESDLSFLMEVCERTTADKKGGHLARSKETGRLLLRESAQCPKADEDTFQDVDRHRFFNTNNLWINLEDLKRELDAREGSLPLALITNRKTVDPRNPDSPKVIQIESAMGAAIECFEKTGAVVVPRSRFAPVKMTADLLTLRSDACRVTDDFRMMLDESRNGIPPVITLDPKHHKLMDGFEDCFRDGTPSLINCRSLRIVGPMRFEMGVSCVGDVEFVNNSERSAVVEGRCYRDESVRLSS